MRIAPGIAKGIASTAERHPSFQGMITSAAYDPTTELTFIGGTFKTVAPYSTKNFLVTGADGTVSDECKNVSPTLGTRYVISDNAGGWVVVSTSNSTTLLRGKLYTTKIFHIKSDGSVNPNFMPTIDQAVYSLQLSGDTLYIGGFFTTVNGIARSRLAALSLSTGALLSWNPTVSSPGSVLSMKLASSGTLYVGGQFTAINGTTRNRAAAFDSSGNLTAWNPNLNGGVLAIETTSYGVYIGGTFTTVGGTARQRFAATDASSGALLTPTSNANNSVSAIKQNSAGTLLYIGGQFSTIAGTARANIACVAIGATPTLNSWYPTINGAVTTIETSATNVYLGGGFQSVNGLSTRRSAVALDPSTAAINSWNPYIPDVYTGLSHNGTYGPTTNSITLYNDKVAMAGDFVGSSKDAVTRNGLAAVKPDGSLSSFAPDITGTNIRISALAVSGDTLYFGGIFAAVGGTTRTNAAAVSISSGALTAWAPQPNGWALKIVPNGSTVYLCGAFSSLNGTSRNGAAATSSSNGSVLSFNASIVTNSFTKINSILLNGSSLYIGGQFDSVGGTLRMSVAKVDATTGAVDANFNTLSTQTTQNLGAGCYYSGTFYPQGSQWFSNSYSDCVFGVGGQWFDSYTATVTSYWARTYNPAPANIIDMAISNGVLYLLGDISSQPSGSIARDSIAAIDANTGALQSWNPNSAAYVGSWNVPQNLGVPGSSLVVTSDRVYVTLPVMLNSPTSAISVLDKTTGAVITKATEASSFYGGPNPTLLGYGLHQLTNGIMLVGQHESARQGPVRIWDTRYNEFRN